MSQLLKGTFDTLTKLHVHRYKYRYPFLETNGIVTVDKNHVGPLYSHVFPPRLAPWLSFIGITIKVGYKCHSFDNYGNFRCSSNGFPVSPQ